MPNTTTSTNNNQLSGYYVDKALITLYNNTPLYDLAIKTPLPQGYGTTVNWNAWIKVAGASSTLAEGGANNAVTLSSRRVTATVSQYSRVIAISDLAEYTYVLNAREGAQKQLRESAKETLEWICHTAIFKSVYFTQNQSKTVILSAMMSSFASAMSDNTGTNSNSNRQFRFPAVFGASVGRLSAVSKTAPSTSAQMSLYSIRKAVLRLNQQNAMPFADGNFVGYAHVNAIHVLTKDQTWKDWNQYMLPKETMYAGEAGRTWAVRWIKSNLCPRYAVAAHSVNMSFLFGQEAYGVTEALGGLEMYLVSGAQKSDPTNTLSYLAYKITAAAATLNPSAGVILFTHELL
jgi:N4-gp56 family major capsid protein